MKLDIEYLLFGTISDFESRSYNFKAKQFTVYYKTNFYDYNFYGRNDYIKNLFTFLITIFENRVPLFFKWMYKYENLIFAEIDRINKFIELVFETETGTRKFKLEYK